MQVRGGDFPLDSDRLGALVLLGGAERSDRIEAFMERAREATEAQETESTDHADQFADDRLENLFCTVLNRRKGFYFGFTDSHNDRGVDRRDRHGPRW